MEHVYSIHDQYTEHKQKYASCSTHRQALSASCPELVSRNASDILERILAEMAVAELVESFGAGQYETIGDLNKTNFLYNIW